MYAARVIGNWWSYVYAVLLAALIGDLIVYAVVHDYDAGLYAKVTGTYNEYDGAAFNVVGASIFLLLLPLLNLYAVAFCTSSAVEAEDDIFREYGNQLDSRAPSDAFRKLLIRLIAASSALILVPLCFWFYSYQASPLWGPDRQFWFQPGFWISIIATILVFLLVPKYFPGLVETLGKIERSIGNYFSKS